MTDTGVGHVRTRLSRPAYLSQPIFLRPTFDDTGANPARMTDTGAGHVYTRLSRPAYLSQPTFLRPTFDNTGANPARMTDTGVGHVCTRLSRPACLRVNPVRMVQRDCGIYDAKGYISKEQCKQRW
jgi:hypothetical protein